MARRPTPGQQPAIADVNDGSGEDDDPDAITSDGVVQPRKRDVTAPREHVYLRQTLPPLDPLVQEVERRRSGRKSD